MKHIVLFFVLALLIAIPAFARVTAPDVSGKVVIGQRMLAADLIAACAYVWFDQTCSDAEVANGICTQQQADAADPWPTVTCTQPRVDNNLCRVRDLGREIPSPQACRQWIDQWHKDTLRAIAANGYKVIRDRAAGPDVDPDPVEDDQ